MIKCLIWRMAHAAWHTMSFVVIDQGTASLQGARAAPHMGPICNTLARTRHRELQCHDLGNKDYDDGSRNLPGLPAGSVPYPDVDR